MGVGFVKDTGKYIHDVGEVQYDGGGIRVSQRLEVLEKQRTWPFSLV